MRRTGQKERSQRHKGYIIRKNSLEVDGRGSSPYSQIPTYNPTQRLRGNLITLNLFLYYNIIIYIIFDLKRLFQLKVIIVLNIIITLK